MQELLTVNTGWKMHVKLLKYSVWRRKPHLEKTESEYNSVVGPKRAHKQYCVSLALQLSSLPPTLVESVLVKEPAKSKCDSLFYITSCSCISISYSSEKKKEAKLLAMLHICFAG